MNQLNKLIEQYERENKDLNCKTRFDDIIGLLEDEEEGLGRFITELLTLALSRPTCGKEQRKFLDEVQSDKFIWKPYSSGIIANNNELHSPTNIFQVNFTADLQKVIQGE